MVQTLALIIAEDSKARPWRPRRQPAAWQPQDRGGQGPGSAIAARRCCADLAVLTGGQVIRPEDLGSKLFETRHARKLGSARSSIEHRPRTTRPFIEQRRQAHRDHARCEQNPQTQIEETSSDYDAKNYQERLAKLAGGVAMIRVGGATEVEVEGKEGSRGRRACTRPALPSRKRSSSGRRRRSASRSSRDSRRVETENDEARGVSILISARARADIHADRRKCRPGRRRSHRGKSLSRRS